VTNKDPRTIYMARVATLRLTQYNASRTNNFIKNQQRSPPQIFDFSGRVVNPPLEGKRVDNPRISLIKEDGKLRYKVHCTDRGVNVLHRNLWTCIKNVKAQEQYIQRKL
jgi:hypothetical protein